MRERVPKRTWLPLVLSAFVYPGAGQFVQKRPVAGCAYALTFTIFFAGLIAHLYRPLIHNLDVVLAWSAEGSQEPFQPIPVLAVLVSFGLALAVYLLNLADVVSAQRRRESRPR